MKIGYPCINLGLQCRAGKTFRLLSYTEEKLIETVENNLECLKEILRYNLSYNILFFRITSDLIPFASHPICEFNWQKHFQKQFRRIGNFINKNNIRISMHPDQFIVINSPSGDIVKRSEAELSYHAQVLDLMRLKTSAKIQLHLGGVYGNKTAAMKRFVENFSKLDAVIKRRLVVENDDRNYTVKDCLEVSGQIGVPALFDVFHHSVNPCEIPLENIFRETAKTWKKKDGLPMVDYSLQQAGKKAGAHAEKINIAAFKNFLARTKGFDFDVMLEIKDKEKSALKAVKAAWEDKRFIKK